MTTTVAALHTGSQRSRLAALGVGAAFALAVATVDTRLVVLVTWVVPVVLAAAADARTSRLPDRLTLGGAAVVVAALLLAAALDGSWSVSARAGLGAGLLGGVLGVMHVASPRGLGFGDVKFGLLVGLGVGVVRPGLTLPVFVSAALLHPVVARSRVWPAQRAAGAVPGVAPFGPSLAAAAIGWVGAVLLLGGGA